MEAPDEDALSLSLSLSASARYTCTASAREDMPKEVKLTVMAGLFPWALVCLSRAGGSLASRLYLRSSSSKWGTMAAMFLFLSCPSIGVITSSTVLSNSITSGRRTRRAFLSAPESSLDALLAASDWPSLTQREDIALRTSLWSVLMFPSTLEGTRKGETSLDTGISRAL